MTMDRDHRLDTRVADQPVESDATHTAAVSDTQPAFSYASQDEATAVAERMMERYEDVLRELAK